MSLHIGARMARGVHFQMKNYRPLSLFLAGRAGYEKDARQRASWACKAAGPRTGPRGHPRGPASLKGRESLLRDDGIAQIAQPFHADHDFVAGLEPARRMAREAHS